MINEFEVKMTPESNWELKFINIFRGISISNNETDYRNKLRTKLDADNHFEIEEKKNEDGYKYYILTISSTKYKVQIRAVSRISLEYFIYHAMQKDPVDTGRPLTFYPHLSNFEAPLVEKRLKENNYQGFFNLILLALFLTHLRLIYSEFIKYGLLLTPQYVYSIVSDYKNSLFILLSVILVSIVTVLTYLIEHFASTNRKLKRIYVFHAFNLFGLVTVPILFHKLNIITPLSGIIGLFIIVAFTLKLISYAHFWYDVRRFIENKNFKLDSNMLTLYKDIKEVIDNYPHNITLSNLVYFLCMPCLCYQYKYPQTASIRKKYVIWYLFQFLLCLFIYILISVQETIPIIVNSFKYIDNKEYPNLFERILKLSIPNVYSWIILFYAFFHCWMNLLAELTRFADRTFYKDWWNSLYLDEYWRKWNIPTHYWMMRHIYNPLRRRKFSKVFCVGVTFFVSGVVHEYVISGGLGYFSVWAFLCMFLNFPVSLIQVYLRESPKFSWCKNSQLWNVLFWICFCFVGQPIAMLLYFYQYSKVNV